MFEPVEMNGTSFGSPTSSFTQADLSVLALRSHHDTEDIRTLVAKIFPP